MQVVAFALGSEEYGVNIAHVQEIIRMVGITHVPRAPHFMEGVINLRGQLIPIVDLRARFGMPRAEATKSTRIVVTGVAGKRIGVVVDAVWEVRNLAVEEIEAAPDLICGAGTEYITGVGKASGHLVVLLDLDKIISVAEKRELETLGEPLNN